LDAVAVVFRNIHTVTTYRVAGWIIEKNALHTAVVNETVPVLAFLHKRRVRPQERRLRYNGRKIAPRIRDIVDPVLQTELIVSVRSFANRCRRILAGRLKHILYRPRKKCDTVYMRIPVRIRVFDFGYQIMPRIVIIEPISLKTDTVLLFYGKLSFEEHFPRSIIRQRKLQDAAFCKNIMIGIKSEYKRLIVIQIHSGMKSISHTRNILHGALKYAGQVAFFLLCLIFADSDKETVLLHRLRPLDHNGIDAALQLCNKHSVGVKYDGKQFAVDPKLSVTGRMYENDRIRCLCAVNKKERKYPFEFLV